MKKIIGFVRFTSFRFGIKFELYADGRFWKNFRDHIALRITRMRIFGNKMFYELVENTFHIAVRPADDDVYEREKKM